MSQSTPQENFYLSQNAKWLNDPGNAIPDEYSSWGSFIRLRDNSLKQQIAILSELANKFNQKSDQLSNDERKLAIVYQKTMQKYKEWDNNKGDYIELNKELYYLKQSIDGENFLNCLAEYGEYCMKNGIGYLFEFDKGSDMQHVDNVLLDMGPCHLSLPTREYYLDDKFKKQRDYYLSHLNNVSKIMKKNSVTLSNNFVTNVFEFEKKMAYIMMTRSQARLYDEFYTKTTLGRVCSGMGTHNFVKQKLDNYKEDDKEISLTEEEKTVITIFMEKLYDKMDLRKYMIQNYTKNLSNNTDDIEKAFDLTIYDGDYFVRMFKLLFDENNRYQCYSWLEYNIIKSMSDYCTKELNEEFFDFYGRKLNDQQEQKTHEKRTVGVVNSWIGELLGKIYVGKHLSENSKNDVIHMIDNVLEMMKDSLTNNTWLTESTKKNALLKLGSFVKKIGYPDILKDYTSLNFNENNTLFEIRNMVKQFMYQTEFLDKINTKLNKKEWLMTPQTVNAYYHPQLNEIVFPAAILQPPFYQSSFELIDMKLEGDKEYYEKLGFDPLIPINHGGIIAVIAHEITHGYDDQGRKFDHQGNMVEWWTEEDIKLFTERTKNMTKQAETYNYTDSENKTYTMKADLTMGENLADLGGLTLSLKALLSNEIYNHPEAIKLFFMSWANVWKENCKEQLKIQKLVSDPHAPTDFRCNLVRNIDHFHQVFKVSEGNKMWLNPEDRVVMW